jgi:hypothetical protein
MEFGESKLTCENNKTVCIVYDVQIWVELVFCLAFLAALGFFLVRKVAKLERQRYAVVFTVLSAAVCVLSLC